MFGTLRGIFDFHTFNVPIRDAVRMDDSYSEQRCRLRKHDLLKPVADDLNAFLDWTQAQGFSSADEAATESEQVLVGVAAARAEERGVSS